jgi:hypothetical protein
MPKESVTGSIIKIKQILKVASVIANLKESRLGIKNLNQFILIIKNWPNDPYVGCNGPMKH